MDLIYMNANKEDVGVLHDYTFDLAFGTDENDFECEIDMASHCCEIGFFLYYEGSEYGGVIDSVSIDTDKSILKYKGRTWHGLLDSKVLEPDSGEDYLIVSGDANAVMTTLIERMGLSNMFVASSEESGVTLSNYKVQRYITGYAGIMKMLKSVGAKLQIAFREGNVELSAVPLHDYSQDEQFDTDQIDFKITKSDNHMNHVICLGQGNLHEREVIHLYTDRQGNLTDTQVLTGIEEIACVYDYSDAESSDALRDGGVDMLKEAWNSDTLEFTFTSNDASFDVGDIVGAKERITGIVVSADVTKKIVKIQKDLTTISYKVGEK